MLAWLSTLSRPKRWGLVLGALAAIFGLGILAHHFRLRSPFAPAASASKVNRPLPAEFLYLDSERQDRSTKWRWTTSATSKRSARARS